MFLKTSKGVASNLNKKLLAGALALTLATTPFTGCVNGLVETDNKNTNVVVSGAMDSSVVKNLKLIEVKYADSNLLFLTIRTRVDNRFNNTTKYCYYNIFDEYSIIVLTGNLGLNPTDIENNDLGIRIIKEENFGDYLLYYGYDKNQYTNEELKEIFEFVKNNYEFENSKTLVKK